MRAFGARGCVSDDQLKRSRAMIAQARAARRQKERAEIAALSNLDIQKIMARKMIEAAAARGSIVRADFHQAGIPDHRIDQNRDAAFRLARKQEPKLDAM